jgi:hypothetical protein
MSISEKSQVSNSNANRIRNMISEEPSFLPEKQKTDMYTSSHMDAIMKNMNFEGDHLNSIISRKEDSLVNNGIEKSDSQVNKIMISDVKDENQQVINNPSQHREDETISDYQKNVFLNSNQISDKVFDESGLDTKRKKVIINQNDDLSEKDQNDVNTRFKKKEADNFNYSLKNLDNRYGNQVYDQSQNMSKDESHIDKDHSYLTDNAWKNNKVFSNQLIQTEINKSDILKKQIKQDYLTFEEKLNEKDLLIQHLYQKIEDLEKNSIPKSQYDSLMQNLMEKEQTLKLLKNNSSFKDESQILKIEDYIVMLQKKNEKIKILITEKEAIKKDYNMLKKEYFNLNIEKQKNNLNVIQSYLNDVEKKNEVYKPTYVNYIPEPHQQQVRRSYVVKRGDRIQDEFKSQRERVVYETENLRTKSPGRKITRYSISKTPSKGYETFPFKSITS